MKKSLEELKAIRSKKLEEIIFEWYSLISWNFFIKVQTNMEGCAWEKRK